MKRGMTPEVSTRMSKEARQYQAEDDCRTLQRAEEIRGDKQRMTHAARHAQTQIKNMSKIASKATPRGKR